jgi:hypothetical protein
MKLPKLKQEKKAPVNFVKKNIMESKSKFKRKPLRNTLAERNRLGVIEFAVEDASFIKDRSISGRRSSRGSSVGSMSKRSGSRNGSGSRNIVLTTQGFNFDIYKQNNKPLPKPGIFISGSRTGREPLPRETKRNISLKKDTFDILNLELSPREKDIGQSSGKVTNQMIKDQLK